MTIRLQPVSPAEIQAPRFGWTASYGVALCVTGLFLTASLMSLGAPRIEPITSGLIALGYGVSAWIAAALLIRGGGILAALPFFLIGTGLFFGFGTFIAVIEPASANHFTYDQQVVLLPKVNSVNALAVFVAVLAAGPLCARLPAGAESGAGAAGATDAIAPLVPTLLVLALPVHAIDWVLFPALENPELNGILDMLVTVPVFAIFVGGVFWQRLGASERLMVAVLFTLVLAEGVLSLAKITAIMAFMSLGLGLWLGGRYRLIGVGVVLSAAVLYFQVLSPVVGFGRSHAVYDPLNNSISQRAQILVETYTAMPELESDAESSYAIARFSPTQFSAYFVASYDDGFAGETLEDAAVVLVPRLLWDNKPVIAPGRSFDGAWRGVEMFSSLAIGFPSEAYWNLGWIGVALVSAYIGMMLGWFSRKWFLFQARGIEHLGIFVMGAMVVRGAIWVETNIVGSYIGGWIKFAIMIMAIDMAIRLARTLRRRRLLGEQDPAAMATIAGE